MANQAGGQRYRDGVPRDGIEERERRVAIERTEEGRRLIDVAYGCIWLYLRQLIHRADSRTTYTDGYICFYPSKIYVAINI